MPVIGQVLEEVQGLRGRVVGGKANRPTAEFGSNFGLPIGFVATSGLFELALLICLPEGMECLDG